MTIAQAIAETDALKPNQYTDTEKTRWLDRLDRRIYDEIVLTHEGSDDVEFSGYDYTTGEQELIAADPYSEVYIFWLECQIDYANGETARYANSSTMFNTAYEDYRNWYNRQHLPKQQKRVYW